ncbi:hypothetical protein NW754_009651 [Fusarium falciforme]|nr:hypothetical protein NW754_009651 [Fusarium falciforme]KAJ4176828.1 hypothetical protein NW767_015315 [Fusarium falciforme]
MFDANWIIEEGKSTVMLQKTAHPKDQAKAGVFASWLQDERLDSMISFAGGRQAPIQGAKGRMPQGSMGSPAWSAPVP